jgi:hypothetical protein
MAKIVDLALASTISFYECVGQLNNGALVYVAFGQTGTAGAIIPPSDTTVSRPAGQAFTNVQWKIYRVLPIDDYVQKLCGDLKIENEQKEDQKRLEVAYDCVIAIVTIAFPESLFVRAVTYTKFSVELVESMMMGNTGEFTTKEVVTLLVGALLKKYIPVLAPQTLFSVSSESAKAAADKAAEVGVEKLAAVLTADDARLSPTLTKLLAIHRLRIQTDPAYLPTLQKMQAIKLEVTRKRQMDELRRRN